MNSKKIKSILLSLTTSTLLVICFYSLYISSTLYTKYINTNIAQKSITLTFILSALVNDLQNERKFSLILKNSNGTVGSFSLKKYMDITNKRINDLNTFINKNSFFELDIFINKVDTGILNIARNNVLTSNSKMINSDKVYQKLNEDILDAMSLFSLSTKDEELKKNMFSLAILSNIIKKVTHENLIMSAVIEKDFFTLKEAKSIELLTFEENNLFKLYSTLSLKSEIENINNILKSNEFTEVKAIKEKMLKKNMDFSIELYLWKKTAVKKIILLKDYKAFLSEETNKLAEEKIDNAIILFLLMLIISILIIIISIIISIRIIKLITNSVIEQEKLLKVLDENIIFSKTNLKGEITHVSTAFTNISSYSKDELINNNYDILSVKDSKNLSSSQILNIILKNDFWIGEMKNIRKDSSIYWLSSKISKNLDLENKYIGNIAFYSDITSKKNLEELSLNLEERIAEKTKDLVQEKSFIQTLLDSQEQFILTVINNKIATCNKSFLNFFNINNLGVFDKKESDIFDIFDIVKSEYLEEKNINQKDYLEYIINNSQEISKVSIKVNNLFHTFSINARHLPHKDNSIIIVLSDITEIEDAKEKIFSLYKHTNESIEFATHIQHAILPSKDSFKTFFKDYLAYWEPKDLVGGDIYLFETLRHKDECLLFIIDCTGHGVPGAFLTMLIKAIKEEIVSDIKNSPNEIVCTSKVLGKMNKKMKDLLKDDKSSNVGFDGAIIYYDKISQILKYSGANINLHYFNEKDELIEIKSDRYSAGYKSCVENYEYKQSILNTSDGMKFYLSTDGYIDQNGGKNSFPFGNKKYLKLINNIHKLPMSEQKDILKETIMNYEQESKKDERNDDITLFAFEIMATEKKNKILIYEGNIRQNIINKFMNIIEERVEDIDLLSKLSTVILKLSQKIMKHSRVEQEYNNEVSSYGLIEVFKNSDNYIIKSENIVSENDKEMITNRLKNIDDTEINNIIKKFKDFRENQNNNKIKGLSFYEIANISDLINIKFKKINRDKFLYTFNIIIKIENANLTV